ncbi:hypothetical protein Tco_0595366 [Tanacetum coccineum]
MLHNVSWDAGHICGLPGKNVQVALEYSTQLVAAFLADRVPSGPETIAHSSRTSLLLFRVITPPFTRIFIIPLAVDRTAYNLLTLGLPIIPLYGEDDLTNMKFI